MCYCESLQKDFSILPLPSLCNEIKSLLPKTRPKCKSFCETEKQCSKIKNSIETSLLLKSLDYGFWSGSFEFGKHKLIKICIYRNINSLLRYYVYLISSINMMGKPDILKNDQKSDKLQ